MWKVSIVAESHVLVRQQKDDFNRSNGTLSHQTVHLSNQLGVVPSDVTYYLALPFVASDDGLVTTETTECLSANAAVMRAEALSRKAGHTGVVALSRIGDPATDDLNDAQITQKFGDVPNDLTGL